MSFGRDHKQIKVDEQPNNFPTLCRGGGKYYMETLFPMRPPPPLSAPPSDTTERAQKDPERGQIMTRKHSSRMLTACFSHSWGGSLETETPLDRDPTEGILDQGQSPPRRNVGPGSQTGSDIIQGTPHPSMDRMTDTCF